tara:strand:+ start:5063 stop:6460 length:1398 start_codon:yes stop_codon:yes gene_type:complete
MRAFLFQQKRKQNGKTITSKIWSCEIMLDSDIKPTRQSLGTTDRRVAQKRMDEIVRDRQQREAGLLVPAQLISAAQRPLIQHIEDFHRDLVTTDRAKEYTRQILSRLKRLSFELGWTSTSQLSADGFVGWRQRHDQLEPRYLNHFLDALNAFGNWMVDNNRLNLNPFEKVKRISIPKGSQGNHRSLSADELRRLLHAAPDRALVYLLAVITGLRHFELRRLRWEDVQLTDQPHLRVRAEATKSKRPETLWLNDEAARLLAEIRSSDCMLKPVFKTMPTTRTFNSDLKRAGIPKHDHLGRSASFHTLRRSLVNMLHSQGVDRRTAMAISRHTSSRLTDHIYADLEAMPTREAVLGIPSLMNQTSARTDMRTDETVSGSVTGSSLVTNTTTNGESQTMINTVDRHTKTAPVATGQKPSINGAGGNRTPAESNYTGFNRRFGVCARNTARSPRRSNAVQTGRFMANAA